MLWHNLFGIFVHSPPLHNLLHSESFITVFQLGCVTFTLGFLFYMLICLYYQEDGGIHHVNTQRVQLKMKTVHNPFLFDVNLQTANYSGVQCTFFGEKDYYLLAVWGVPVYELCHILKSDPEVLKNSIASSSENEMFSSSCKSSSDLLLVEGGEEKTVVFKPQEGFINEPEIEETEGYFRLKYPFVAITILKDHDSGEDALIAMATVVHLPDEKFKMPARIIGQFTISSSGRVSFVKKIYISSEVTQVDGEDVLLCLTCCTKVVSTVVLPCCHACVCTTCLELCKDNCPVCRGPASSYFEI